MKQDFLCKFCGTKFHKEKTMITHLCVKKQRYADTETAGARFGLRVFQRFYDLTMNSKKTKTVQEFIESQYYIDFVKFGNHLALLKPLYIDKYIDFVILNGVKLADWTKEFVYECYIEDLIKKEPAESATERTITNIIEWASKNNCEFNEFFSSIPPNEAAYLIKVGKISPWVLYLSATGGKLLSRLSEEHGKIIGPMIEPSVWMRKFKKLPNDVDYIRNLLEQAEL